MFFVSYQPPVFSTTHTLSVFLAPIVFVFSALRMLGACLVCEDFPPCAGDSWGVYTTQWSAQLMLADCFPYQAAGGLFCPAVAV